MRYLLLIHSDETRYAKLSPQENEELMAAYGKFTQDLEASGALRGADRLTPTTSATTVRMREGKLLTTDGPFAETKEQFGGYYEIDVENLDEAITWASKVPSAQYGSIEVRPVWD